MPSYKIYVIKKKPDFKNLFSSNWLDHVKPLRGDLEATSQKIESLKENYETIEIINNEKLADEAYTLKYRFNMQLPGETMVWIPEDLKIIYRDNFLYISRGQGNIRFLIEKYLSANLDILPKDFKKKGLINIWKNLEKQSNEIGFNVKLHRLILHKVFLEGDFLNEMNLSTNNIQNIGYFKQLIQDSEEIRAITFKIRWNALSSENEILKDITSRLDSSGNLLVYGNHLKESINRLLLTLSRCFSNR